MRKRWNALEILFLIAFVVILFAMAFPMPFPPGGSAISRAETTAFNLKYAISTYFVEYREYPQRDSANDITIESGHALMDILLGSTKQRFVGGRNVRGIVFFADVQAKPMGGGLFKKGLKLDADSGGELWDSWGNFYRVRFDSNLDNKLEDPEVPGTWVSDSIAVWSAGPDGDFETWKDNVKTW